MSDGSRPEIEGYELLEPIGAGGMGVVYRARQRSLDRIVAIKILRDERAANPALVQRFRTEALAAARIRHPGIVQVHDAGEGDGFHYIVMELLEGRSVARWLAEEGKLPVRDVLAVARAVGEALDHAWTTAGLIHRDLKPDNLIVSPSGTIKVVDLGIARIGEVASNVTSLDAFVGTPQYASPEQVHGERSLDCRSDIYSLGATLYHLVTGRPPFADAEGLGAAVRHVTETVPDPCDLDPDIPHPVGWLLEKAMVKRRTLRYHDWKAFLADLDLVEAGKRPAPLPPQGESTVERGAARRDAISFPTDEPETAAAEPPGPAGPARTPAGAPAPAPSALRRWSLLLALAAVWIITGIVLALRTGGDDPGAASSPDALVYGAVPFLDESTEDRWAPLVRYIERTTGRPIRIVSPPSYAAVTDKLISGEIDFADLSAYPYLLARRRDPGIRPLVSGTLEGQQTYESYLLVPRESSIQTVADLAGKRFCYVDPISTSGYVIPRLMMRAAGLDPDAALGSFQFSAHHHRALQDLLAGRCDAAAMSSSSYVSAKNTNAVRILQISPPLPYGVVCAGAHVPEEVAEDVRQALLAFDVRRDLGRDQLSPDILITGYTPVDAPAFERLESLVSFATDESTPPP